MVNESWYEKIEAYLSGKMNPEEQLHFNEEIAKNEELSSVFQMYRRIDEGMQNDEKYKEEEEALKETLYKLNSIYFRKEGPSISEPGTKATATEFSEKERIGENHKVRRFNIWKSIAVAASTLGIIALGITLYLANTGENPDNPGMAANNKKPDASKNIEAPLVQVEESKVDTNENGQTKNSGETIREVLYRLYRKNFQPDKSPDVEDEFLAEAFEYFDIKKYTTAIEAFSDVDLTSVSRGDETDTVLRKFYVHYYKGQSYMAINNLKSAVVELKDAINQGIDSLQPKAQWYLALAYLKKGEVNKTDSLLNIVAADNIKPEYKSKANRLLNDLMKEK